MAKCLEITRRAIRLCAVDSHGIQTLESHPIAGDDDPIAALARAPLSPNLGAVRVVISHPDMLLRTMTQPPMPEDRLARVIRFEMQELRGEDGIEPLSTWHIPAVGGTGDMRILVMVVKPGLITALQKALKPHGGRLGALVHPGVALFRAWAGQAAQLDESAFLIDCGGASIHVSLVVQGELLFWRSHNPGADDLAAEVAKLRGVGQEEATALLGRLGADVPADLQDLIARFSSSVASYANNTLRFAKAQTQLQEVKPQAVYLAGAGARLPGFAEALGKRLSAAPRILNPFAGRFMSIDMAKADVLAELPSPWVNAVAVAVAPGSLPLDGIEPLRRRAREFWQTSGALRASLVGTATLALLAALLAWWNASVQTAAIRELIGQSEKKVEEGEPDLVDRANAARARVADKQAETAALKQHMAFLREERHPGRAAVELLTVIARLQDPEKLPVRLRSYRMTCTDKGLSVELEGTVKNAADLANSVVHNTFKARLTEAYKIITDIKVVTFKRDESTKDMVFQWLISINA